MAWFALGAREFDARAYDPAARDLARAASSDASLASFAEYYEALADEHLNRPSDGVSALTGFSARYPASVLRVRATELLAKLLLTDNEPGRALDALQAEAQSRHRASSLLLIAQAFEALGRNAEAVKAYQTVYDRFPTASEAQSAADALRRLRFRMGAAYPRRSLEDASDRAARLAEAGQYDRALDDYDQLMRDHPEAPRGALQLGRARCFLGMRNYREALAALRSPDPQDPALDARRMALIVHINELYGQEPDLTATLEELYRKYPGSPAYADALAYAGGFYARQGAWQAAERYYAALSSTFPHARYAEEATWRVAWYHVLAGELRSARAALLLFLTRYPRSPRVPAALYWLAEVTLREREARNAAEIFRLVSARFPNTYYGLKAREANRGSLRRVDDPAGAEAAAERLAAAGVHLHPRRHPPLPACAPPKTEDSLTIYSTLEALSLHSLSDGYLDAVVATHARNPALFYSVARLRYDSRHFTAAIFDAGRAVPDYSQFAFTSLPESLWRILYPDPYWPLVRRYARSSGLDPYLVMGLIRQESAFNPHATSVTHARGLMQIEPYTAAGRVRGRWRRRRVVRDLYYPAFNIREGCRYFRFLLDEFHGNIPEALAAYNAGDIRVRQWIANSGVNNPADFVETIPFTDTRAYVVEVLRDAMIYRTLFGGRARFANCRLHRRIAHRGLTGRNQSARHSEEVAAATDEESCLVPLPGKNSERDSSTSFHSVSE